MKPDETDIRDLFTLYREECNWVASKCGIEESEIDYDAFGEALKRFFYDTSISAIQHCNCCGIKVGNRNLNSDKYWICKECEAEDD